jgi:catechol 2,3-dioxygenase-like lactoylglutathione lyase family enzyme
MHVLLYSRDPEADRAFLRDVLDLPQVEHPESGPGWPVFKPPPAEIGLQPTDGPEFAEVHLVCDDLREVLRELRGKGATVSEIGDVGYGIAGTVTLPSGLQLNLYEPKHPNEQSL